MRVSVRPEVGMDDTDSSEKKYWLTPSRIIGLVVFGLALLHPFTRVVALGYAVGRVLVWCIRTAVTGSSSTDKSDD